MNEPNQQTKQVIDQLFHMTASGVNPSTISELFSEDVDFEITGGSDHVSWIGKK